MLKRFRKCIWNLTDSTVESGLVFFLELSEDDAVPAVVVEGVVVVEAVAGLLVGFSVRKEAIFMLFFVTLILTDFKERQIV